MPEADSDPESQARAQRLCDDLGVEAVVEDIAPALTALGCYARRDAAVRRLVPDFGPGWRLKITLAQGLLDTDRVSWFDLTVADPDGALTTARMPTDVYLEVVAATNMKQRTRKLIEYTHADARNHAVLGTPNRLEYELGFFVRGGDGLADVKPISHLYKTQVYALAEHLGLPEEIRSQPPSTDTYSLPQTQEEFYFALPYAEMDLLLWAWHHDVAPADGRPGRRAAARPGRAGLPRHRRQAAGGRTRPAGRGGDRARGPLVRPAGEPGARAGELGRQRGGRVKVPDRYRAGISRCSPADADDLRAFQLRTFEAGSREVDAARTAWLFDRNPCRTADGTRDIYVCRRDGEIVGQQAEIPFDLRVGGRDRRAAWTVDLMVDDDWRLRGVGPGLMATQLDARPLSFGLNLSEKGYATYDAQRVERPGRRPRLPAPPRPGRRGPRWPAPRPRRAGGTRRRARAAGGRRGRGGCAARRRRPPGRRRAPRRPQRRRVGGRVRPLPGAGPARPGRPRLAHRRPARRRAAPSPLPGRAGPPRRVRGGPGRRDAGDADGGGRRLPRPSPLGRPAAGGRGPGRPGPGCGGHVGEDAQRPGRPGAAPGRLRPPGPGRPTSPSASWPMPRTTMRT